MIYKNNKDNIKSLKSKLAYDYKEQNEFLVSRINDCARFDIMNKEAFDKFISDLDNISNSYNVSVEKPLPNAIKRGVYKVVFFNKHLIGEFGVQTIELS